jgi:hypothetical protein
MEALIILPENAVKMAEWLRTRGGLAIWNSVDLSDPGFSMTTPVLTGDLKPYPKPHWKVENQPSRIITDAAEVVVSEDVEVKRFHIAVRMGSQGLTLKLTDASTRRVRKEVEKAGEGAYYTFDYGTQEAVIMKPAKQTPLLDYLKGKQKHASV